MNQRYMLLRRIADFPKQFLTGVIRIKINWGTGVCEYVECRGQEKEPSLPDK